MKKHNYSLFLASMMLPTQKNYYDKDLILRQNSTTENVSFDVG